MTHHNISASTLARTAALALALTNQVLSAVGKPILPIESAQLEHCFSSARPTWNRRKPTSIRR